MKTILAHFAPENPHLVTKISLIVAKCCVIKRLEVTVK